MTWEKAVLSGSVLRFIFIIAALCELAIGEQAHGQIAVAAGAGLGVMGSSPGSGSTVVVGDVKWQTRWGMPVGIEAWRSASSERICGGTLGNPDCGRTFPDFTGVAGTVSRRLRRVTVGAGLGMFDRYWSASDHAFVPGAVGEIGVDVTHLGKLRLGISARPLLTSSGRGSAAWCVPVVATLGR